MLGKCKPPGLITRLIEQPQGDPKKKNCPLSTALVLRENLRVRSAALCGLNETQERLKENHERHSDVAPIWGSSDVFETSLIPLK